MRSANDRRAWRRRRTSCATRRASPRKYCVRHVMRDRRKLRSRQHRAEDHASTRNRDAACAPSFRFAIPGTSLPRVVQELQIGGPAACYTRSATHALCQRDEHVGELLGDLRRRQRDLETLVRLVAGSRSIHGCAAVPGLPTAARAPANCAPICKRACQGSPDGCEPPVDGSAIALGSTSPSDFACCSDSA